MLLITAILDAIFPPRDTELLVRSATFSSLEELIIPSKVQIEADTVTTLLPYRSRLVQAFILEAKFYNNKKAQEFLGKILSQYLTYIWSNLPKQSIQQILVIPVPLGKKRRKERGYNQIEEIAKHIVHPSIVLEPKILNRSRETKPQMTLKRSSRLLNMRSAFVISPNFKENLRPNSQILYIIVDDVVTTGSTLLAAKETLSKAKIQNILMLALAH